MPVTTTRLATRLLPGLVAALGLYNLVAYSGNWGGDPEIHMVFAENLLHGHVLEFNPGHATSGETSPLYMGLVALMQLIAGKAQTPLLMKAVGLLALGLAVAVAVRPLADRRTALAFALYTVAVPSMAFQASLGMENMLFAAVFVWCLHRMLFTAPDPGDGAPAWRGAAGLACLAFLAFYLRPEAIFLFAAGGLHHLLRREAAAVAVYAAGGAACLLSLAGIEALTGAPVHGAGAIRSVLSANESLMIPLFGADVLVNPKPAYFLLAGAGPIAVAVHAVLAGPRLPRAARARVIVLACVILGPLALHFLNVLPNIHFSRYQLYLFFTLVLLAADLHARLPAAPRGGRAGAALMLAIAPAVFAVETGARSLGLDRMLTPERFAEIRRMQTGETRDATSDALCAALPPCAAGERVTVALQEVQLRLRLDDRFHVASLDGIVDHTLGRFVDARGCVDHFGYLEARSVDLLMAFRDYAPRGVDCGVTLSDVEAALRGGEPFTHRGLAFQPVTLGGRLHARIVAVP